MIITKQQWEQAQAGELAITRYDDSLDQERVSSIILEFFNKTTKSFKGKKILEVGGGPFPAVGFCNGTKATVVDPLSDQFNTKYRGDNVNWVSEQFEDIVNAAGKPIPIYDRYYLSDDEMQGVLNYYQLDMDGNETTVIDDHVKYQSDTYNEEYFNNLEDMETLKGGYK